MCRTMDPTIMKTIFRFGLPRQVAGLLLLLYCLPVSHGRAADAVAVPPPEGSAAEAIVLETSDVIGQDH
jgi:hypothetical protein